MTFLQRAAFLLIVACMTVAVCQAAFTYPWSYVDLRSSRFMEKGAEFDNWANEVEDRLDGTTAAAGIKLTTFKLGSTTFTLPTADGTSGQVLTTNGSAVLAGSANAGTWAGGAISSDGVLANGKYIESDTTVAHTAGLALRDTTAAAYVPVVLMTNGTTNGTNSVAFGYSSVPMTIASYGGLNVGATGNMTGVGTIAAAGDITLATTKVVKSSVTDTQTVGMSVYDVDGTAYRNVIQGTNGNTPAVLIGATQNSLAIASTGLNVSTAGAVSGVASIGFTSGASMYLDVVTVSSAELLDLYANPKTIVAAPGTHNVIDVVSCVLFYDYGGTAYGTVGNNLTLKYTDGSGAAVSGTLAETGFLDQTSDRVAKVLPVAVAATAVAGVENQAVKLTVGTASPTTGNGVVRVSISYRILPSGF
jgi:hypothetical protein